MEPLSRVERAEKSRHCSIPGSALKGVYHHVWSSLGHCCRPGSIVAAGLRRLTCFQLLDSPAAGASSDCVTVQPLLRPADKHSMISSFDVLNLRCYTMKKYARHLPTDNH